MKKKRTVKRKKKKELNLLEFLKESIFLIIMLFIDIFLFLVLKVILRNKIKAFIIAAIFYLICLIPTIYRLITGKKKKKRTKKEQRKFIKRIIILCLGMGIVLIAFMISFFTMIIIKSPDFDPNLLYNANSTTIYWSDGTELAKIGSENRKNIEYSEISENLINAIIATEDARFFQHNGFDLPRFMVASFKQALGQRNAGGASTLTMQVVKNTYTSTQSKGIAGIIRKFTDIYMSIFKVEKKYTKEQIIEFYVNSNYLGAGAHGVEVASLTYFNKPASELTLPEAAMIAGLFNSPSRLDPYRNPQGCEERRQTVLHLMKRHGYINNEEYENAKDITVAQMIKPKTLMVDSAYQGVIDTVVSEVEKKFNVNPYVVPMQVYTTFRKDKQDIVNKVFTGETFTWENSVIQAGVSILDTQTGALIAIGVGRRNNNDARQYNFAIDTKKQIGSTAKPLYAYGPAIEYEGWSTYHPVTDEPYFYSNGTPLSNWNNTYQGYMTSREALAESRNIPAVKVFQANKKENVVKFVKGLGLNPELGNNNDLFEAHALGGYTGESPLTMSAAYAAFGNGGYYNAPYSITKVVYDSSGEVWEYKPTKTRAMSEETAYIVYDMLRSSGEFGIGRYYRMIGGDFGAKTGTTNFDQATKNAHPKWPKNPINDSWVSGVNKEYSICLWYGYDKAYDDYVQVSGKGISWRVFYAIAKNFYGKNAPRIEQPAGVISVTVENMTVPPMLPSANTPSHMLTSGLWRKGTEPTEVSTRYKTLDNVTNLTASNNGNSIQLSWSAVRTPDAFNQDKISELGSKLYHDPGRRAGFINDRNNYNQNILGGMGYNVYVQTSNGLELIGFTKETTINYKPTVNGKIDFVVKTVYPYYTACNSSGVSTSYLYSGASEETITSKLNGVETVTIDVGVRFQDMNPPILVYNNDTDVSNEATIEKSYYRHSDGKSVTGIDTSKPETYTITYNVKYKSYSQRHKRTVIVK
jgi:penicillin-binding protein 1A